MLSFTSLVKLSLRYSAIAVSVKVVEVTPVMGKFFPKQLQFSLESTFAVTV